MKSTGKIMFYGLYAVLALGFFLYLLFPSQAVRDLVVARIEQTHPDIRVHMEGAHPVFPPGLKLAPLSVAYAGVPILNMAHLKVLPGIFSFLGSQKHLAFSGPMGSGALKGHADLKLDVPQPEVKLTLNLAGIPVEELEALKQLHQFGLAGTLTAYIDFDSLKGPGGTANINMEITPARIVFNAPLLGLEQLEFSQIQSEATLTPRMLQIRRLDASGAQLESRTTGSIVFREPFQNSRINLSCMIKPQAGFVAEQKDTMIGAMLASPTAQQRGILIRIAGTLEKPSYVVR
jgi:type II secretion system protein N